MALWFSAAPGSANTAAGASTPSISSKMFQSPSAIIPARTARFTAVITTTQEANDMNLVPLGNIVAALVFAFVGIFIFVIAFMLMDKLTPYHLWKEIVQEHNMALAILVGAMSLGICIIIAAAIH
jgi:putative membrane protein